MSSSRDCAPAARLTSNNGGQYQEMKLLEAYGFEEK